MIYLQSSRNYWCALVPTRLEFILKVWRLAAREDPADSMHRECMR